MKNIIIKTHAIHLLLVAVTVLLQTIAVKAESIQQTPLRETVLDRKVHIEKDLVNVPDIARLCEEMDIQKRHVNVGECELYCELEGNGTPLVLINGGPGATHHCFHPSFSQAKGHFKIVYYDQRGCGLSQFKKGKGYSIDQAVEDIDHLREALNINKWIVLGHSYGGTLAQSYAAKYPEHVLGLVLVGSAYDGLPIKESGTRQYDYMSPEEKERIRQIYKTPGLSEEQIVFNIHLNGDWKRQNFYKPTTDELARLARYEWVHDDKFRGEISQSLAKLDIEGVFKDCPIPILLMEGKWDLTWAKDKPAKLQACFPSSKLVIFEYSGHSPFQDEPDKFFGSLKQFADNLPTVSDPNVSQWKTQLEQLDREKQKSPKSLLKHSGWGRQSNQTIAQQYSRQWLTQINDSSLLLKTGFALYDSQRYEEALEVFQKMSVFARDDLFHLAVSRIWQGHMLDLLGRRAQAIAVYKRVVQMNVRGSIKHDQYRLSYVPSEYAAERLKTPFTRLENQSQD